MTRTPQPGDTAPPFEAPDQHGRTHRLEDYRGEWLVVYFYPKDDTPGCVREACAFRDRLERITDAGIRLVGVSADDADSHRAFAERHGLAYPLLADPGKVMIRAWGAKGFLGLPKRVTFLVDPEGVVRHVHEGHLRPAQHVDATLAAHARLAGAPEKRPSP